MTDPITPSESKDITGLQQHDPAQTPWRSIPRRTLAIALSVLPLVALINVGILIWSLGGINLSERLVRPDLLGLVAILVFVPMLTNSLRLAIWARFLGQPLGFVRALKVVTGTMVVNSVTPSATGSVPIKVLFLMGEGVATRGALTLISFQAAEDAVVLFSLLGICAGISGFALFEFLASDPALAARFVGSLQTAGLIIASVLTGLFVLSLLVMGGVIGHTAKALMMRISAKIRASIGQIIGDWGAAVSTGKMIALANLVLATGQWAVRFSVAGLVLAAFGVEWQPALFWLLQYLVQSISSLIPTPGGAGGAEAGFLLLFAPFVPVDMLVPSMSTWRLMFFYLPLIGAALVFLVLTRRINWRRRKDAGSQGDDVAIQPAE